MADFSIIDAHVHLWDPHRMPIPWLNAEPALDRTYSMADYAQQTTDLPIAGMLYVEVDVAPQFALLEAQHIAALAQQEPHLLGIIPTAPVEFGSRLRPYLEALSELGPLIKGVRRLIQDAPPDYYLQPDFIQGVRLLAEFGYSFDLCIRHHQMKAVTELVRRCPGVTFILDHLGKPDIRHHVLYPWRADLEQLAKLPNIACKVSGLLTEADPHQWQIADLAPYISHALDVFGHERLLFGSDWPVMTQAAAYPQWVDVVKATLAVLPETTQSAIWRGNAEHWYRLTLNS